MNGRAVRGRGRGVRQHEGAELAQRAGPVPHSTPAPDPRPLAPLLHVSRAMARPRFFYRETSGIRVTVWPSYLREQSQPAQGHFVFAYKIRIENVGAQPAQLLARRWRIHDAAAGDSEVEGEGVVGQQPTIAPGRVHEYRSYCLLKSPSGAMEGEYLFVRSDRSTFEVAIPRFELVAEE